MLCAKLVSEERTRVVGKLEVAEQNDTTLECCYCTSEVLVEAIVLKTTDDDYRCFPVCLLLSTVWSTTTKKK